ncbi:MAG TPA: DUF5723 family protein [Pseudobacter sp.]|nr:DUF5723 family protein [Pseudobacter sp.]
MRKVYLCALMMAATGGAYAQSYPGYRSSNYTGVNGVFFNPANAADSRSRWDINLFSIDGFVGNNQNSLSFKDITKSSFNSDSLKSKLLSGGGNNLNAMARVDILGPSVLFNAGARTGIALTTRARIFGNARDMNGPLARAVIDAGEANANYPFNFSESKSILNSAAWTEIGASVGQILTRDKSHHFVKVGLTVKYLAGVADAYLRRENFNGTVANGGSGTYLTNATGRVYLNTTEANFKDYDFGDFFKFNGHGIGGDVGLVYEYRPNLDYSKYEDDRFANKYKVKVGVALLDVGEIKFNKSGNQSGVYSMNIPNGQQFLLNQFKDKSVSEYKSILDASPYFTPDANVDEKYKVSLPTSIQINVDYLIAKGFYANANAQITTSKTGNLNLFAWNSYTVTPRWEVSKFGVALPINYSELTQWNAGISLRAGPVFLGSGSLFTAIFDKTKQADLHVGIRFGLQAKKKIRKDTDMDGVYDDQDSCLTVPGVARYNGCPIPDTDGDGVNDEQDSCRTVPGLAKYNGCPIPDRDGDGVNDEIDECPDQPGSGQFKGCPDTDGDGIPDKDDKCPTVAGVAKYNGCPIPDRDGDGVNDDEDLCPDKPGPASSKGCPVEDVVVQITADFKNILFDFNKATIKEESRSILETAARTMNEVIPNSNFYVDGYTDNIGSVAANKKISKLRAQAVADALTAAGVDKSRLIARGFGKDNPKCSNKTEEGRACNRRVEVVIRNVDQQKVKSANP